ncbi:MAG TPA: cell division protein ZapE [Luteimonas sp.]|nr:cell division protein ZapE [Luteimonas sp.]
MAADAGAARPSQRYREGVERGDWTDDPAQHAPLRELDRIHDALLADAPRGLVSRLFGRDHEAAIQGLYLWGGVGRGKTFLIDLFHAGLPLPDATPPPAFDATGDAPAPARGDGIGKRRTHFHRFMGDVHARLRQHAGERDPLAAVVRDWRAATRVLVLDEFFVSDIGDAMLLARLLERMVAEGMVLVTSSNAAPKDLYPGGLQRVRFEPAIALIERHCAVVELASDTDYRLRALTRSPVYRCPLDAGSDAWLDARWRELGGDASHRDCGILLQDRRIAVRARGQGMAWFDFATLCEGPRAAADYIEIACEFHTVLLGGIPRLDGLQDDAARRFVTLVDELYDRHVNLVCTADATPAGLYVGQRLVAAFARTASRLVEMQSVDYMAQPHLK